jgi:TolB protein
MSMSIRIRPSRLPLAAIVALLLACGDVHAPVEPADTPGPTGAPEAEPVPAAPLSVVIVSNPAGSGGPAIGSAQLGSSVVVDFVYASLAPGTVPRGERVVIRTRATGAEVGTALTNGGFDPIAIPATVGDTLDVRLYLVDQTEPEESIAVVPERRPPVLVRVDPTPGRRDVPLNVVLLLVFSEPIDASTLTPTSVSLSQGESPVAGTLAFGDAARLTVRFTPAEPLAAGADYTLLVTQELADLDGDALGAPTLTEFSTTATDADGDPPPGSQLVFTSLADGQLYTVAVDGTGHRRLTGEGMNSRPSWSPDGRRIAFARDYGSAADIYVMDADGSNVVRRTVDSHLWPAVVCCVPGGLRSAVWSPDGLWLAVSTEGLYDSDIWLIPADDDGSPPVHLATGARSPAWSPDGRRIAFVRISGDDGYDALGTMNADGSDVILLTPASSGRYGVAWSPDGLHIASSVCVGRCDVFAMAPDGTDVRPLTDVGNASWGGSWSPDGRWVAFTVWDAADGPSVFYVGSDGGIARVITSDAFAAAWRP